MIEFFFSLCLIFSAFTLAAIVSFAEGVCVDLNKKAMIYLPVAAVVCGLIALALKATQGGAA
ncbi:hypothetical protein [Vibrio cholerae]|uniref:hypothetical protein n=1 Tax=Vibrio cholerae TaxID=666 RepID=UPI000E6BC2B2|nr:hypothetical protein [Vibrio cholerae]AYC07032.1 hypothetical protein FORC73_3081 [Vibrio cholerae]